MKTTKFYKLTPRKTEFTSTLEILKSIIHFIHVLSLDKKNELKGPQNPAIPTSE